MSEKARKPEDRSNVHKGNRGSPVSNLPPQLGPSAAVAAATATMMPHASYEIPSSHHMHHHPLQYGAIIRPPAAIHHHMPPHLGRVTNDLGPPIFMPSLNLGIPKPQQSSSSTSQSNSSGGVPGNSGSSATSTISGGSKTTKSSLSSQPSMNNPTAFMAPAELIQFPSAFHPHPMRPPSGGQGHTSYIPASAPPPPSHPSSMNMKLSAPQSLSSSTIAKPTPIPATAASHTSSGIVRPTPKSAAASTQGAGAAINKQPVSAPSKGVMSSSSKGEPPSTSMNLMYGFQPHPMMSYGILNPAVAAAVTAPLPSHGQLSKMLLGSSQHSSSHSHPPTLPPPNRSFKSDGSNGSSKAAASQVTSSATTGASHKSGSYVVDGYTSRSSVSLSTSGQPTSTAATYMDTKMEHPPQPSAVPLLPQQSISSLSVPPPLSSSSTTYSHPSPPSPPTSTVVGAAGSSKDRPTTAEAAASNLIISKQALTGKQIASITGSSGGTTGTAAQSSLAADTTTSYATSLVSNSNLVIMATVASSLGAVGGGARGSNSAEFVMSSQSQSQGSSGQGGGVMEWSTSSQQQQQQGRSTSSVSSSSYSLPSAAGVAAPSSSSMTGQEQGGSSGNSSHHNHHHASNGTSRDASLSISTATATSSSFSGAGIMGSPSKSLTASPGGGTTSSPRPHILRGGMKRPHESGLKENSHHSPGSSAFLNKLSNTNSCARQKGSRQDYGAPLSPGSQDVGLSNHLSSSSFIKSEPPDMTASPRKKPRKQNVIANDDQYASNVPDGFVSMATSEYHEGGRQQGEEAGSKSQPLIYNSLTSRNARVKMEPREAGSGKEVEVRYLSQLKRCPYPINGVYKVQHRAARNHFRRHADIKHREDHHPSISEIADNKTSLQRASGWKIIHFRSQLQELSEVEEDILKTMQRLQDSVNNLDQTGTCQVDPECANTFKELVQGNLDRSNRVLSHVGDTKLEIEKVLEHKPQVSEILKKFSTLKSSTQSLRPSSNLHHKNCS